MSDTQISGDVQNISRNAGENFNSAMEFPISDFLQGLEDPGSGLKYALLRLELLGLTAQDRTELAELGLLAVSELDVEKAANQIINRESASPLAVAIANIMRTVENAPGRSSKRAAMLGAVSGAYTGLADVVGVSSASSAVLKGVVGAIAGACAVSTSTKLQDQMQVDVWSRFWIG